MCNVLYFNQVDFRLERIEVDARIKPDLVWCKKVFHNTLQFDIPAAKGGFKEHPAVNNKDIVSCEHNFRFFNVFKKAPDALLHPVGFGSNISTETFSYFFSSLAFSVSDD